MADRNSPNMNSGSEEDFNVSGGKQNTDSAPADEDQSMDRDVQETQKGKNKVDGDLSKESDRPIQQTP
jgi:hypothetical protein